jgi:hypothetical protein
MKTAPMPVAEAHRRYVLQFVGLMICYVWILCVSLKLLHMVSQGWLRVPIALAPVLPIILLGGAVARLFSRVDELCRRIHLEAGALAAGVTALLALTWGFLQNVGMPALSGFWTFGVLDVLYVAFVLVLRRRYR